MEENSNLPFKANEVESLLATAPDTLSRNELSVSACKNAGQTLLDTVESTGGITSDEMDNEIQSYLSKTKKTIDNMNIRRKPITQMLAAISRRFTSLESDIDIKSYGTIPFRLQQERNKYAAKKLEEQKRREEEARRKQMEENEKASFRADVSLLLDNSFAGYVESRKNALRDAMNNATLSSYNQTCDIIKYASVKFEWNDYVQHVHCDLHTLYIPQEERDNIKKAVARDKKAEYERTYLKEMSEIRQQLIDRLPSLKKQLEEQEVLRRTNAEEAERVAAERKAKEAEERMKLEAERRLKETEAKAKAEAEKAAAEVQAAFDFGSSGTETDVKAKVKKKIQITNPQGFLAVYQLWFTREGINLSMDELEKIHKKMIGFCEKAANKDGEQIQSAYVRYVDDVTAK